MDVGWFARDGDLAKHLPPRPRPAWNSDREVGQLGFMKSMSHPRSPVGGQGFILVPKRFDLARIETVDLILGQRKLEHDTILPRQRTKA